MNGRRPKPENRLAALLAAGPTDAEGRLRRAILTAIGANAGPMTYTQVWRAAAPPAARDDVGAPTVRGTLDALVRDGMLVRADYSDGYECWDLP